jgi:hypothetical protein
MSAYSRKPGLQWNRRPGLGVAGNAACRRFVLFIEVINAKAKRSSRDNPADFDIDVRQRDPVPALWRPKKIIVSVHLGNSTLASAAGAGATAI